jgi:hypothetical protein
MWLDLQQGPAAQLELLWCTRHQVVGVNQVPYYSGTGSHKLTAALHSGMSGSELL